MNIINIKYSTNTYQDDQKMLKKIKENRDYVKEHTHSPNTGCSCLGM